MVTYNHSEYYTNCSYHCIYCGCDGKKYYYNDDALMAMYGKNHIVMNERMPDILSGAMGKLYIYCSL